jgi:class 3 adenylate cyclase/predicted ATPase
MQQIARWLKKLGMSEYAQRFADNDIDFSVLHHLTDQHLKDLGVSLGHRLKMLQAIRELGGGPAAMAPIKPEPPTTTKSRDAAERRQLTVMFCDLVDSTALSTKLDPEDLRGIIAAYHRCCTELVERNGGFVAKYMGDGVLIYFGYPRAHEDDAERAVRAGLGCLDAVRHLNIKSVKLQARIGIATGLVVVGDLIGEGSAQEQSVVGETPNLAARLQATAEPGRLTIAESTRQQIGALFDLEDLGARQLAGFAEPQRAWRVLCESSVVSRFEALRSEATPLVGRDEELALLLRRWDQAKAGEGRVVLVSGEPGIGKSRLTAAVNNAVAETPHRRMRWFCSPQHQDSSLYPIIVQIERAAGFARDDSPDVRLAKLHDLVVDGRDGEFELLAEMLTLPNSTASLNLSAPRQRELLLEALLRQFALLARQLPVLAVFEDAHWIDPTSREVLELMVEHVSGLPVLLIVTSRPEFQAPWSAQPHVTSLALSRLGGREVGALVQGIAGNTALDDEVVREIVERTDGVPLFVEELTKAVLESGAPERHITAVLVANPVSALAVPPTLYASLMSRLDRLGTAAKEAAQVGSVLGREFSYELIAPVAKRPEVELQAALDQLTEAGLLFCRGVPPYASYIFKHALVQDAAYGTLLRARRQEFHARVAAVLEASFADLAERQPELLAHHLTAAGANQRAVDQWLKSGQRAAGRGAHIEAISHLKRGLAILRSLPKTAVRDANETEFQLALGMSSITVKGMGSAEMAGAYGRALQLAECCGSDRQLFQALFGIWIRNSGTGGIRAARPYLERLLRVAEESADDELQLQAHHSAWSTLWSAGEPMKAHSHTDAGRRLYDRGRHHSHRHIYGGHDPGVCARITGGITEWLLGFPDKALASASEGLALAQQIAHPFSREVALEYSALVHLHCGEVERALRLLDEAQVLRTEQRLASVFEPRFPLGAALLAQGAVADAVACLREGLVPDKPAGSLGYPYALCLLAEALLRQGSSTDAMAALAEARARVDATGERAWEAEVHRINGLALLTQANLDEAQVLLNQALEVARKQQAKSLELRASMSLARLWAEQGRRADARNLLGPIYQWFGEGFATADLKEASVLHAEIT